MLIEPVKTYSRLWSINSGIVMVVTDLHGDWDIYRRYRDQFVDLQANDQADYLIFTGDLIHRDPGNGLDRSLDIVLDVVKLQKAYGETIIYLCGNHELPHLYGFGLGKGDIEYTPRFEAELSERNLRSIVIETFDKLPFYIRTSSGVAITHAGATNTIVESKQAHRVFEWDHKTLLAEAEKWLASSNLPKLRRVYARLSGVKSYEELARHYLSVDGIDDSRYNDLLKGFFVTTNPDFIKIQSALFTRCEKEYGPEEYRKALMTLLNHLSDDYVPQQVLIAGHMNVSGGHQVVEKRHLRLASGCHASSRENGEYILFDAESPITKATDLLSSVQSIFQVA